MNTEMIVIEKEECVQDDARWLIQSAADAKRRHLARRKPIRGVLHVQFPPAGVAVCCADCAPKKKPRICVASFLCDRYTIDERGVSSFRNDGVQELIKRVSLVQFQKLKTITLQRNSFDFETRFFLTG